MAAKQANGDVEDDERCSFYLLTLRASPMVWIQDGRHVNDGASNGDEDNWL